MIERSINGTGFCGRSDSLAWLEGPTTVNMLHAPSQDSSYLLLTRELYFFN